MYQLTPILIMALFTGMCSYAQELMPQTLNAGGQSYTANNIFLESNVGGLVVADNSTVEFMYTPDFLQPHAGTTTTIPGISHVVFSSGSGIDNAGHSFQSSNVSLEFTVGEFVSITHQQGMYMLTQGILQPFEQMAALPVTGLSFTAKRSSSSLVQLNWKTMQESNNSGFTIERRKAHEANFIPLKFVASRAPEGNSTLPLEYATNDTNSYNGKSWYRLLQEDKDGSGTYSVVRLVGGGKDKLVSLKAWPVPAAGPFAVQAEGIGQEQLQVFDMSGKMRQQKVIQNGIPLNIQGLPAGTYLLRLAGVPDVLIKVVVQ